MRFHFYTADVFSDRIFGGNQLAVFPDATGLNSKLMQLVAREFNFSETVFVFPPQQAPHTRLLRIFTPTTEVPFAGHPTIGAAHVLAAIGEVKLEGDVTRIVFEEEAGAIEVTVKSEGGRPVCVQLSAPNLPEPGPTPPSRGEIASMLSLEQTDLLGTGYAPEALSCGVPFLFVPLRDLDAVRRVRMRQEKWERLLSSYWAPHVYVFTYGGRSEGSDIHARMFAPALGIDEDPATGAAATALAGYLGVRNDAHDGTLRWLVEQGIELGRPSLLKLEADKAGGQITAVRVGGAAVMVSEGSMEVPTS